MTAYPIELIHEDNQAANTVACFFWFTENETNIILDKDETMIKVALTNEILIRRYVVTEA